MKEKEKTKAVVMGLRVWPAEGDPTWQGYVCLFRPTRGPEPTTLILPGLTAALAGAKPLPLAVYLGRN